MYNKEIWPLVSVSSFWFILVSNVLDCILHFLRTLLMVPLFGTVHHVAANSVCGFGREVSFPSICQSIPSASAYSFLGFVC